MWKHQQHLKRLKNCAPTSPFPKKKDISSSHQQKSVHPQEKQRVYNFCTRLTERSARSRSLSHVQSAMDMVLDTVADGSCDAEHTASNDLNFFCGFSNIVIGLDEWDTIGEASSTLQPCGQKIPCFQLQPAKHHTPMHTSASSRLEASRKHNSFTRKHYTITSVCYHLGKHSGIAMTFMIPAKCLNGCPHKVARLLVCRVVFLRGVAQVLMCDICLCT